MGKTPLNIKANSTDDVENNIEDVIGYDIKKVKKNGNIEFITNSDPGGLPEFGGY